ncbi:PH domain-like [Phytophthora cactorum]|nr:PH domain-like [Phytophthora cactorum]
MRTTPEGTAVDIVLGVSVETVHAITVHQNKMVFQSPVGVMKEIVWDYSEKSLEAYFTAILALPDLEKPPQQIYIGVLIGQNLPSPIQQRRAIAGFNQPALLPMAKRRELLRSEQPFIRSGFLCFTCSINTDLRGLTLGVHQLRVFPSPDCHDRSACLFSYAYEHLESCEVSGTRLELRFRSTHQLAKQPSFLVFQSLESQYIREAIWYLKNGTYMDASLRQLLASPSLRQRIDACCRVIGCENLVECNDRSSSRQDEASASNVMINSGELSPMVLTNGLCVFHASCLSLPPSEALTRQKSRDKPPVPKLMQPLITLLQSTHYARTFKFQGQLLKRQNAHNALPRDDRHAKRATNYRLELSAVYPPGVFIESCQSKQCEHPTMHAFDVVTLYRTWTFAAMEPEQYEIWLHVLTECVEKHATIASDKILRFPVKLAMTGQTCATEATSLEISSHGVSFCTGHEAEVVLSTWYYTDLEKWSVVFQQGYLCCLLKCRSPAPASPGSSRTSAGDTITQDFLFRTTEASTICLAIEFYVGKCMAKLEVLAGKFLEETRVHKMKENW